MLSLLILIISFLPCVNAQNATDDMAGPGWKEMIVIPVDKKPATDGLVLPQPYFGQDITDEPEGIKVPTFSMGLVGGVIFTPPLVKFKSNIATGVDIHWLKGLYIGLLGVFPDKLHLNVAWMFRIYDDRIIPTNICFYFGLSMLEKAGDIFPGLIDVRKYAPSVGLRFSFRNENSFSGFTLDNRYEIELDNSSAVRTLILLGYFFPL